MNRWIYLKIPFELALALLKLKEKQSHTHRKVHCGHEGKPVDLWWDESPTGHVMKSCGLHSPTPGNKKPHVPCKLPAAEPEWGARNLAWGKLNTVVQPDFHWVVLETVDKLCIRQRYFQTLGSLHSKGCFNLYPKPHCFIL